MNRETVELGFVLRQIEDYEFSMKGFDDRLRFQKTVYLLQAFGVYLGYSFSWYMRGPHCTVLASNGLLLQDVYASIPEQKVGFDDKKSQKSFKKFLKFVRGKSTDDLEIAASLHCLVHACGLPAGAARSRVEAEQQRFGARRIAQIWSEMEKCRLVCR